jgi:uncharacterized membrane protein YedE/YeeE
VRHHLVLGLFGLALGVVVSAAGFSDWGEIHRAFSLGAARGGPTTDDVRLVLAFAGAVALALAGFRLLAWRDELPAKPVRPGTIPGAILFGVGWAIAGACPGAVLVQLGEGKAAAAVTLVGILAGTRLHDRLRKRFGWARHSCVD